MQPFDKFWFTPNQHREIFAEKEWKRIVAHQTRNVPHSGHEWLMKGAWFSAHGELPVEKLTTGILVSCIIGPKRTGDYIDEAILLGHEKFVMRGISEMMFIRFHMCFGICVTPGPRRRCCTPL